MKLKRKNNNSKLILTKPIPINIYQYNTILVKFSTDIEKKKIVDD